MGPEHLDLERASWGREKEWASMSSTFQLRHRPVDRGHPHSRPWFCKKGVMVPVWQDHEACATLSTWVRT